MEFRVETEDGYILRVHRIIGKNIGGPPILFRHGFGAASDSWLMNGRNIDLAFQLADEGFDVWLDDRRGNWYSREHVKYKPNSLDFWNFSFHESAYYDLPAVINQIINITKYDQVFYVGHSMSCAEYLIMASLRPEYNDRIKLAVLLSPVAKTRRIENIKSPLIKLIMLSADSFYVSFTLNFITNEMFSITFLSKVILHIYSSNFV
ncbi:hypothetical protein O3M35_005512 [Rhynocoris fuscipes]|uniref:AB hydrolase-1 domain-containing protein n=1 Tax=Rhynocoris fuscipes TaxID=488301 RepID=A0AAW1DM63_9HEMI